MKKQMVFLIIVFVSLTFSKGTCEGKDYTTFQDLSVLDGKALVEYEDSELWSLYKKVDSRKFSGWNIHYMNRDKKVVFKSETIFSFYNNGKSPISYNYVLTEQTIDKISMSATGQIGVSFSGNIKKFKNGLNASLKLEGAYQNTKDKKEQITMKFDVEPGTMANLYIAGEGKITNGVAANYFFWLRKERGAFEYFILTTSYQRLEIVRV